MGVTENDMMLIEYGLGVFLEALGDFERPSIENTPQPLIRFNVWIMFLLLQMITNVVALNTLIAIIGDSYERVQNDRESYDALQRIELLDELNDFYVLFNRAERRLVFLNVVSYSTRGEDENNEWGGRLKIITKTLESSIARVRTEVAGVKSEIATIKTEIKSDNVATTATIKSEISEIKRQNARIEEQLSKLLAKEDQRKDASSSDMESVKLTLKVKQVKKN